MGDLSEAAGFNSLVAESAFCAMINTNIVPKVILLSFLYKAMARTIARSGPPLTTVSRLFKDEHLLGRGAQENKKQIMRMLGIARSTST